MSSTDPFLQVPGDDARAASAPQPAYAPQPGYTQPGYAPQAGYAQPGYSQPPAPTYTAPSPYQQPTSGGTDGISIAALVTGLLGTGPLAVVLGAVGLRRTADGRRGGTAMAWVGLAFGLVATVVWTAVVTASVMASVEISEAFEDVMETSQSTYGDDPYLDGLWDACDQGDMVACDDLFNESPLGSDYESFGESCGELGLPEDQVWCAD